MTAATLSLRFAAAFSRLWVNTHTGTVTEWCERELRFNEPERVGSFSLHQREYLREPLDCYDRDDITDLALCFGTRAGKTTILFSGSAYKIVKRATRGLNVKPTSKGPAGAENDARTRAIPMFRASPRIAEMIPSGAQRHNFKNAQQIFLNGSILDWVGSNSVAQLASNPCQFVNLDEVDKFNSTRRKDEDGTIIEANACDLAFERTGEALHPLRVEASTPTLPGGRIWQSLLATDLRRRFMPCPLCGRHHPRSRLVVLAWSEDFTVLPKTTWFGKPIPLAYAQWDKEARRADGSWDLERVEKSAGYTCPHCQGRFHDDTKPWMDKNGLWLPTKRGAPNSRGYHLPSMYASHPSTTAGALAVDFLQSLKTPEGPRNLINSKFAEPYAAQDISKKRIEIVTKSKVTGDATKLLSIDCQQVSPYFWFIVRAFMPQESIGLAGGPLETWDDVRSVQEEHKIPDAGVVVDSGWGSKDNAEVYRTCAQYGELIYDSVLQKHIHIGWTPAKAMPGRRMWRDPETKLFVPYYWRALDLYQGTADAGKVKGELFEYASDEYQDQLERLRKNKTAFKWTISAELDNDEYHTQMRGDVMVEERGKLVWKKRHRHARNHLRDCEKQLLARASANGLLAIEEKEQPK